jgi:hypothetical protein
MSVVGSVGLVLQGSKLQDEEGHWIPSSSGSKVLNPWHVLYIDEIHDRLPELITLVSWTADMEGFFFTISHLTHSLCHVAPGMSLTSLSLSFPLCSLCTIDAIYPFTSHLLIVSCCSSLFASRRQEYSDSNFLLHSTYNESTFSEIIFT